MMFEMVFIVIGIIITILSCWAKHFCKDMHAKQEIHLWIYIFTLGLHFKAIILRTPSNCNVATNTIYHV